MVVKKLSSKFMVHEQLLFETKDELSRSVTGIVRMARQEIRKSESIIAQSQAAIERARKLLDQTSRRRAEITGKPKSGGGSKV